LGEGEGAAAGGVGRGEGREGWERKGGMGGERSEWEEMGGGDGGHEGHMNGGINLELIKLIPRHEY